MEVKLIVYPGFMMVLLTLMLYIKNRLAVGEAFQNKEIKSSYLKVYKERNKMNIPKPKHDIATHAFYFSNALKGSKNA